MATNYSGEPPAGGAAEGNDSPMFAPIPSWERGKKRRGLGGARGAAAAPVTETRSFEIPQTAGEVRTADGEAPQAGATMAANPAPAYVRTTTTKRRSNAAPLAIAAGVVLIGGLAAAGWYASQPRDAGVAALTPGSTETSSTALATAPMGTAPGLTTSTAAPPATTTTTTTTARAETPAVTRRTTTTRTASATRTRPAPAASVTEAGVNASATLPAAPIPYAASADAAATGAVTPEQPAPLAVNPAPVISQPSTAAEPPPAVTTTPAPAPEIATPPADAPTP